MPREEGELALDRYRLCERLGAGGFGVVWRAHDEQLGREVALKRIPLPSQEDSQRAAREALACARLSHPAIVALYEACAQQEEFFLISELVAGQTLAQLLDDDELEDEHVLEVVAAVAGALEHAHGRGVIHRDVKPQNIIVVDEPAHREGVAKLADFGGASLVGEDALTRAGDVLGTLAYMAPEQCDGEQAGPEADVYSLALVAYEALAGFHPVRGRTPAETARRIGQPLVPLRRHRRDLPRVLTEGIDAALDPDPWRRSTLAELREAFEDGLAALAGDGEADAPATFRRKRGRSPQGDATRVLQAPARRALQAPLASPALVEEDPDRPARLSSARAPAPLADEEAAAEQDRPPRLALPRAFWLAVPLALAVWQAAVGNAGVSLLVAAAGAPLLLLPRRAQPTWLAAAFAPALGWIGLAAAFPAIAGQLRTWRARAALAALGFWWIALAEPLAGRRLWQGPAPGTPPRGGWEGSLAHAATHVLGRMPWLQLAIGAAVWAAAALVLPWIVRGRSAALDAAAAIAWTVALLASAPLLVAAAGAAGGHVTPRGMLVGAAVGCVLAVCARAARGPV